MSRVLELSDPGISHTPHIEYPSNAFVERRRSVRSSILVQGLITRAQLTRMKDKFYEMDDDDTGTLSITELQNLWLAIFPGLTEAEAEKETLAVWRDLDTSGDNQLAFEELIQYVTGYVLKPDADIEKLISGSIYPTARPIGWKQWLWAILEQNEEFNIKWLLRVALSVTFMSQTAILLSIAIMVVESLPSSQNKDGTVGGKTTFILESYCIGVFTIEVFLRAISTPTPRSFWLNGWTVIDMLSIFPYYLERSGALNEGSDARSLVVLRILRLARLVRVLRVIKLGRHSQGVHILVVALKRSSFALTWLAAILLMAMTLFASLMWSVEKEGSTFDFDKRLWIRNNDSTYRDRGQPIFMQDIPDAMVCFFITA